jgi:mono/diheme cytochrome c family protein
MPAFGAKPAYGANRGFPALSAKEIWDVLFYVKTFSATPASVALGRDIYQNRAVDLGNGRTATCAACHGPAGDGRGGALSAEMASVVWGWATGDGHGLFTNMNLMLQRKPSELYQWIWAPARGLMPAYQATLKDEEVWALVDYLWTFLYDYTPARGQR